MSVPPRRKPHGTLAHIFVGTGPKGLREQALPESKEEIERLVMSQVVAYMTQHGISFPPHLGTFTRTKESDFDFTLSTRGAPRYVELTEIAPLKRFGGAYARVPGSYRRGAAADLIVAAIHSKASKYAATTRSQVHLLTYVTDWRLTVDEGVLRLVAHNLCKAPSGFASVLYFIPGGQTEGSLNLLSPTSEDKLDDATLHALGKAVVLRPDLTTGEASADGKSIEFKVGWPPLGGA